MQEGLVYPLAVRVNIDDCHEVLKGLPVLPATVEIDAAVERSLCDVGAARLGEGNYRKAN